MKKPLGSAITTICLLMVAFQLFSGGMEGLVLCLGEGNHIRVEASHAKRSTDAAEPVQNDFHGQCMDISLAISSLEINTMPSTSLLLSVNMPILTVASHYIKTSVSFPKIYPLTYQTVESYTLAFISHIILQV